MSRLILGMTGLAGSGKDTAAARLIDGGGFVRLALGDELKRNLYILNPPVPLDSSYIQLADLVDTLGWDQAKAYPVVRSMLQRLGSDAGWQFHGKSLWTSRLDAKIAELDDDQDIVVTDVRMPHEARWIRSIGGVVIKVTRQRALEQLTPEQRTHISEQGIADPDHLVTNDTSIADLHRAMDRIVELLRENNDPTLGRSA